jgi:aminoglycoside 6'-N-acetyltransferase
MPDTMPSPRGIPEPATVIEGGRVRLRLLGPRDRPAVIATLSHPGVARWWSPGGPENAVRYLFEPGQVGYVIEVEGEVAGAIFYEEVVEPDYEAASIDIFLGDPYQGRGLGPDAIRALARYLIDVRGHHRLTIDPALANEPAIKAYEKVGFRRVGIARSYERGPDGSWHDNLLMDLLAGELS